jgi:hypothetical protein
MGWHLKPEQASVPTPWSEDDDISFNSIYHVIFVKGARCVFFAVRTEYLHITRMILGFEVLK